MNKENLLKLANFLETAPTEIFNFNEVVRAYDKTNECGSVCCAIGWTPRLFPELVEWIHGSNVAWKGEDTIRGYTEVAMRLFDICFSDVVGLFTPNRQYLLEQVYETISDDIDPFNPTSIVFPNLTGDTKPQQVAQLIRNYVEIVGKAQSQCV